MRGKIAKAFCLFLLAGWMVLSGGNSQFLFAGSTSSKKVVHYALTGRVEGLEKGHLAKIALTGKAKRSTYTRKDGTYVFKDLLAGTYEARPSHPKYHFTPNFHTVAITNHDMQDINFTAHRNK
jgi:hypothetical protein